MSAWKISGTLFNLKHDNAGLFLLQVSTSSI